MSTISVQAGEREKVVSQPPDNAQVVLEPRETSVLVGSSKQSLGSNGRRVAPGDRVVIRPRGKSVFVFNQRASVTAEVEVTVSDMVMRFDQSDGPVDSGRYPRGSAFDSSNYPVTVDPSFTVKTITLTAVPDSIELEITTTGGDNFTATLTDVVTAEIPDYNVEQFVLKNPSNAGTNSSGFVAGVD